jgi:heptosyltransferase-2
MIPDPISILVIAPNWLGDAVMALPAIADIRRRFPAAKLVVAARASVADLFALAPGIDEVVELQWNGRWSRRAEFRSDAARLGDVAADVAILLPNSFASAWLAKSARIPERWGFGTDLRGRLLTRPVRRPKGSVHQGAYYQHLTSSLGIAPGQLHPLLIVPEPAISAARVLLTERGWDGRRGLIVLAPGAAYGTAKRWIPAHVAGLSDALVRERDAICVLVGSRGDRRTTSAVRGLMHADTAARAIDVAGETTLAVLAGVFALAQACVSNDSGAMHVAAAIGTPVVAVFGPTREYETAPLTSPGGRAEVVTHPVWCRPCMLRECPIDHRCMTRITPDRILLALDHLMAGSAR